MADLVARNDGHVMENICYGKFNLYQKKAFCTKVQVLFFLSQFSQNPEFRSIHKNKDFFIYFVIFFAKFDINYSLWIFEKFSSTNSDYLLDSL